MIEVNQISKIFSNTVALDNISFEIKKGEVFGFLGPSGAGKTTLINILIGQLSQDSGTAKLNGKDSRHLKPKDLEEIGLVGDTIGFYEKLSLYKNLILFGKLYGVKKEQIDAILTSVGLYEARDTVAEKLSTGMKQRMLLARALINYPKILFLDEPTSGLDPMTSKKIHQLLLELKHNGTTIFLTTHDMNEATFLCDNLALLNKGKLVEQGKPREIIQKYNLNKELEVTYDDFSTETIAFAELNELDTTRVVKIHSCEPTLEDIFIKLTGEKLND